MRKWRHSGRWRKFNRLNTTVGFNNRCPRSESTEWLQDFWKYHISHMALNSLHPRATQAPSYYFPRRSGKSEDPEATWGWWPRCPHCQQNLPKGCSEASDCLSMLYSCCRCRVVANTRYPKSFQSCQFSSLASSLPRSSLLHPTTGSSNWTAAAAPAAAIHCPGAIGSTWLCRVISLTKAQITSP